jgi:hypothetical protein
MTLAASQGRPDPGGDIDSTMCPVAQQELPFPKNRILSPLMARRRYDSVPVAENERRRSSKHVGKRTAHRGRRRTDLVEVRFAAEEAVGGRAAVKIIRNAEM